MNRDADNRRSHEIQSARGSSGLRVLLVLACIVTAAPASESPLTFEQHIRPIFKAHCFDCHGEGDTLKGGLDLRLRRLMIHGGESGPALTPGQPDASLLVQKIRAGEMPKRAKKLSPDELRLLESWIAQGADTARPEPESIASGMLITPEERSHWAFQPLQPVEPPSARPGERARNPVDAFLLEKLRALGLGFSPDADPRALIRRATLDLHGLPPTPEEVEEFVQDNRPEAYELLLDRLLASPRYGERWARHWLDIAGYADSEGYSESDPERPHAWRYRDYVIRSFNDDKPFDRFLTEQLAGDELALASQTDLQQAVADPQAVDLLIATGFLRMGADGTGASGVDQETARNAVLADTIKIVSTSLLGLSVGCAQCHDHRYEPIPQSDYYRLRALFEPAYDPSQWKNPGQRLVSLYTPADRDQARAIEAEAQSLADERAGKQKRYLEEALEEHLKKFDESLRGPLRDAHFTPANERTEAHKKLLADHPSVNIHPGVLYQYNPKAAEDLKAMDAQIAGVRARKPAEHFVRALTESPGQLPVTHRLHRGDPKQPREPVGPGALSVLSADAAPVEFPGKDAVRSTSGRRLAFARWLTGPDQALMPRVMVNRVWMHHFGRGIVSTPADLGVQSEAPTHPELLDWLARKFIAPVHAAPPEPGAPEPGLGWSLKRLHKSLMMSTAYRQASPPHAEGAARDPDNQLYWRKPLQRLDAETIRDATLAVSGSLHSAMFGPPVPVREDATGQIVVGIDRKEGDNKMPVDVPMGGEEFRRSIYVQVRRSRPLAFLNAFDAPVMEVNCEQRVVSTAAPQALMLMNSQFILDQSARFARRVARESGDNPRRQIDRAWRLAWGRPPSARELTRALDFLERQSAQMPSGSGNPAQGDPDGKESAPATDQALVNLCQVLLSANEFLYVN